MYYFLVVCIAVLFVLYTTLMLPYPPVVSLDQYICSLFVFCILVIVVLLVGSEEFLN